MTATPPPRDSSEASRPDAPALPRPGADPSTRLEHLLRRSRGDPRPHPLQALLQAYRAQKPTPGADHG